MLASVERIPSRWESVSGSEMRVSVPPPPLSLVPRPLLLMVESPPRERESCPVRADLRNEVDVLCQPRLLASGTGDGGGRSEGMEKQFSIWIWHMGFTCILGFQLNMSTSKIVCYLFCSTCDESLACLPLISFLPISSACLGSCGRPKSRLVCESPSFPEKRHRN